MKLKTPLLLVAAGALFASACSLILPFDPEGQACGEFNRCLDDYGCVDGMCVKGADAGSFDCRECPIGDCVPGTNSCLPNTCQYKICQAGFECVEDPNGAGPQCRSIPVGPGNLGFGGCFSDDGCHGSNRRCMLGAVPTQAVGPIRGGICVEECGPNDTCTLNSATCRSFNIGLNAGVTKVCLPTNTLTSCSNSQTCARANLVCTVFDNPLTGPITACDLPLSTGAKTGEACVRRNDDGGTVCANGLCVPDPATGASGTPVCAQTCDPNSCISEYCAPVEYQLPSVNQAIRYVPMCISNISNCFSCAAGPTTTCKPDAPHCVEYNSASRCLGACTASLDGGAFQCPADYQCTQLDAGSFCTPVTGVCP